MKIEIIGVLSQQKEVSVFRHGKFEAKYRHKYLGTFKTEQEARAAIDNYLKSLSAV